LGNPVVHQLDKGHIKLVYSLNMPRLELEFTSKAMDGLTAIVERIKAPSKAEVIRQALDLYDDVTRMKQEGWKIQLVRGDISTDI
jgi:hypothetical protein